MKYSPLYLFVFAVVLLMSCQQRPVSGSVDAATFHTNLQNSPGAIILDIRTPEEFAEGYIPGAINLDYYADDFEARLSAMDTTKTYFIYCQEGGRSKPAFEWMSTHGFSNVQELNGGFSEWQQAGLETSANPE